MTRAEKIEQLLKNMNEAENELRLAALNVATVNGMTHLRDAARAFASAENVFRMAIEGRRF